jgi:hypothetical protein
MAITILLMWRHAVVQSRTGAFQGTGGYGAFRVYRVCPVACQIVQLPMIWRT